jgi:hypothetical protein
MFRFETKEKKKRNVLLQKSDLAALQTTYDRDFKFYSVFPVKKMTRKWRNHLNRSYSLYVFVTSHSSL